MPRDVRNLVTVVGIRRVSDINRVLPGVPQTDNGSQFSERQTGVESRVQAGDPHLAQIEHRPAELLAFRIGYDLVGDPVAVAVDRDLDPGVSRHIHKLAGESGTHVELGGIFRLQGGVAHIGVVEVVEGRHPEHPFPESAQRQVVTAERLVGQEESRSGKGFVRTRLEASYLLVDEVPQHAGLPFQSAQFEGRG